MFIFEKGSGQKKNQTINKRFKKHKPSYAPVISCLIWPFSPKMIMA